MNEVHVGKFSLKILDVVCSLGHQRLLLLVLSFLINWNNYTLNWRLWSANDSVAICM